MFDRTEAFRSKKIVVKYTCEDFSFGTYVTVRLPKEIPFLDLIIWEVWLQLQTHPAHRHREMLKHIKALLPKIIVNSHSRKTADWFRKPTCEQPVAAFWPICIFMSARLFDTGSAAVTSGPDLPHMMLWIIKQRIVISSGTLELYDLCHYKIRHCSDSQSIVYMQRQLFVFYCFISSKKSNLEPSSLICPSCSCYQEFVTKVFCIYNHDRMKWDSDFYTYSQSLHVSPQSPILHPPSSVDCHALMENSTRGSILGIFLCRTLRSGKKKQNKKKKKKSHPAMWHYRHRTEQHLDFFLLLNFVSGKCFFR